MPAPLGATNSSATRADASNNKPAPKPSFFDSRSAIALTLMFGVVALGAATALIMRTQDMSLDKVPFKVPSNPALLGIAAPASFLTVGMAAKILSSKKADVAAPISRLARQDSVPSSTDFVSS